MTLAFHDIPLAQSPLASWDTRWKLIGFGVAIATVATLQTLAATLAALVLTVGLIGFGRVPWRWYRLRLAELLAFMILFGLVLPFLTVDREPLWRWGPLSLSGTGLHLAIVISAKTVAVVSLVAVLITSAPLSTLAHAAFALRAPALLIQLTLLSYRFIFLLAEELTRIRAALRTRGYRNRACMHSYRTVGHVLGAMFIRSHDRAERTGHAMRCRGFDGRYRSLAQFQTRTRDVAAALTLAGAFVALAVWERWE